MTWSQGPKIPPQKFWKKSTPNWWNVFHIIRDCMIAHNYPRTLKTKWLTYCHKYLLHLHLLREKSPLPLLIHVRYSKAWVVRPILSVCKCAQADRTFRFVAARTSYARVRNECACATCFIVLYARTTCGFSCVRARTVATHALRYSSYCCSFIFTKTADHCLSFLINMKFSP